MRKGPVPKKALAIALPVALARGFVILCQRDRTSEIDLVIAGNGRTAFVCICRTKTLNALPAVLEAQFRILIAVLRRVPPCPGRSCEIWACDYNGNLRLFRLTATGMEEIGRDGNPLALPAPVPADGSAASIPLHDRGGDPCMISRSGVPYHRALSRWRRNPRIGEAG